MKFSKKIFISVFVATFVVGALMIWTAYYYVSNGTKEKFFARYSVLTKVLGDTLTRLDSNTESFMLNAAKVVVEKDAANGLLSTNELKRLAGDLNVTHIFVIDRAGKFIRSTNENPSLIPNLFTFADEYRKLVTGEADMMATPIIQPQPEPKPYKFLLVPNNDRSRIIEIGVRVDFIARTLAEAIKADSNVISMSLYSPEGVPFGRFAKDNVEFQDGRSDLPSDMGSIIETKDSFKVYSRVTSSHPSCAQCDTAGTSVGGEYYYMLESEISKRELTSTLTTIATVFGFFAFVNLILSFLFGRVLSRHLVKNIEAAVAKVRAIKVGGDSTERINLKGDDEVAFLTAEFDNLLDSMEQSRAKIIEAERVQAKVQMARDVAHNIRSPILAIEMTLPTLVSVPERMRRVISSSVKEIKGLAEKLSQKNAFDDLDLSGNRPTEALTFLPVFLDEIVNQKRVEFSNLKEIEFNFENLGLVSSEFLQVDRVELRSILSNLVNNAVESYGGHGGLVTVTCKDQPNTCLITIGDSGAGIPPEYLARLGEESFTFKGNFGRGVGFMHAAQKIREWGGSVEVQSAVGIGTMVSIIIPRYVSKNEVRSTPETVNEISVLRN